MAEGLVTFFKYKRLGFYQRGTEYCEPLSMANMLSNLHSWFNTRTSLADTLLWDDETPGYQLRKKVYLKSIQHNNETGDYILILWRAVGNGNGVYGIRSNAALNDNALYNANDAGNGDDIIWGEPSYYWFIPRHNVFASIKFPSSIADTKLMNSFLKDFMWLHSTLRPKFRETKENSKGGMYTSVHFRSESGENLWFGIESEQFTKLTNQADLGQIASEITHFVRREVISAREMQSSGWRRLCGSLPFISNEITRDTRRIEIIVDASPTADELRGMLDTYHEEFSHVGDDWSNLGFKKDGVGGICWLDKFVVKNTLLVSELGEQNEDSGHYTTQRLFNALHLTRDRLLSPFSGGHVVSSQVAENII
ncbi:hypothetical protein [Aeromonas veronii]|uniref:hypothetical protein n=1 Tax=Aeromonas veronii TaxID=654 RepID=UPI003D25EE90